ncbi:MAG: tetratricopeptide repeat protein [Patescibacteria group bacterium]
MSEAFKGREVPFAVAEKTEQRVFSNPAVGGFFTVWCSENNHILPQIIDKKAWDAKSKDNILEQGANGGKILYLHEKLQLWDIVGVLEEVDKDTFKDKPERQREVSGKMRELMTFLRDTGVYFYSRRDKVEQINQQRLRRGMLKSGSDQTRERAHATAEIAGSLGEALYTYGTKFGKGTEPPIAEATLSPERTLCLDIFVTTGKILSEEESREFLSFLTDPASRVDEAKVKSYRAIQMMLPQRNVLVHAVRKEAYRQRPQEPIMGDEEYRSEKIAHFFRIAELSFTLQQREARGELRTVPHDSHTEQEARSRRSDTPIHSTFLNKVEKALEKPMEAPRRELVNAVFRRGMQLLADTMPLDKLPDSVRHTHLHWRDGEETLREAVQIDRLRVELETVRQTKDRAAISKKERKIADLIQQVVSSYPRNEDADTPKKALATQCVNCVGASELGGALMQEAGLRYLVGNVPEHSLLFLVTSDGNIEWRDMLKPSLNGRLTNKMIFGTNHDGTQTTVADLVAFAHNPDPRGISFELQTSEMPWSEMPKWIREGLLNSVTLFQSEYGQDIQLLNNVGYTLIESNQPEEALVAFDQAIALNPHFSTFYNNRGNALLRLGRLKEALHDYDQAIVLDSHFAPPYYNRGNVLKRLNQPEEALHDYDQAIALDSHFAPPYYNRGSTLVFLGRPEEAIESYRQFIALLDSTEHASLIAKAEGAISQLEWELGYSKKRS